MTSQGGHFTPADGTKPGGLSASTKHAGPRRLFSEFAVGAQDASATGLGGASESAKAAQQSAGRTSRGRHEDATRTPRGRHEADSDAGSSTTGAVDGIRLAGACCRARCWLWRGYGQTAGGPPRFNEQLAVATRVRSGIAPGAGFPPNDPETRPMHMY